MPGRRPDPGIIPGSGRLIVAFSGGPDSTCLLHLLASMDSPRPLLAVHVDHGLDADSPRRAEAAADFAAGLGVECLHRRVAVSDRHGQGPEAAARQARYAALGEIVQAGDALLTAHHADDQAETVLLRLLRGAGVAGLSGIPRQRPFGDGWLYRPLLDWTREEIHAYLARHGLKAVADPGNDDLSADRNYLRHRVLPLIRERWPGADTALHNSARHCRAAADALVRQAAADLQNCACSRGDGEPVLDAVRWLALGLARAQEVLVWWCRNRGVPPPPERRIREFLAQCATAGTDRLPALHWEHGILRRHAGQVFLDPAADDQSPWLLSWDASGILELPSGLGRLELFGGDSGVPPATEWTVTGGEPGERLQLAENGARQRVSELMRRAGVPPWRRHYWPRIHRRGALAAVGDRWLDTGFRQWLDQHGLRLAWHRPRHPGAPVADTIPGTFRVD